MRFGQDRTVQQRYYIKNEPDRLRRRQKIRLEMRDDVCYKMLMSQVAYFAQRCLRRYTQHDMAAET